MTTRQTSFSGQTGQTGQTGLAGLAHSRKNDLTNSCIFAADNDIHGDALVECQSCFDQNVFTASVHASQEERVRTFTLGYSIGPLARLHAEVFDNLLDSLCKKR
jgi:hypothetical protein